MILKTGVIVTIVNGPSKFDLTTAFTDRFGQGASDPTPQRTVKFTGNIKPDAVKGQTDEIDLIAEVRIDSLEWEDGSGHGWIFEGHLTKGGDFQLSVLKGDLAPSKIKGYYNSKSHRGHFMSV